jgi:hypothetical protein
MLFSIKMFWEKCSYFLLLIFFSHLIHFCFFILSGESPSSSASDVDNLNNHATVDKVSLLKGASSPLVAANHVVIAARNRSSFDKVLHFAQDTIAAMDASKKSQVAFTAASLAEAKSEEVISSIKRALDFNFQDVDGLLRLVRLAMEAISR